MSFSHRDARNAAPGASEQETAKAVAANVWVDANGGGCRRTRTPVDYSDAAACASFNAAYQAAEPGDIVRVVAGTYPYQELLAKAGARAPNIVIQAAVAGTVVVKEFEVKGADYLTIRNLTVTPFTGRSPSDKLVDIDHGTTHLTLDNVDLDGRIGGVRQVRDGLGISGDTDYVTVRNSDICCIQDNKLIQVQTYRTSIQNRHLTLSGNTIHDVWQTDSRKHLECLWLEGVSDFVLEGNHFWDCALNAILANADEGGTYANWTIVNNVFEDADAGVAGVPPDVDGCAETHGKSNWLVAYNYFSRGLALTSCRGSLSWLTMRGNIGAVGDFECGGGATWEYNTWAERKCSSTDTENRNITAAGNYVGAKAKGATGPGDYRPSSTAAPQINTGHPTSWPAADAGGAARPIRITASITRTAGLVRVKGNVSPSRAGRRVLLTFYEKKNGVLQKLVVKRPLLSSRSNYSTSLSGPRGVECVMTATVAGDRRSFVNGRADAGPYERPENTERLLQTNFRC